jgi:hypothetical protein
VTPKKRPEYQIKYDSAGIFTVGQIIPDSRYNMVKEDYDIRMKEWDGGGQHAGEGIVQISGGKRDFVKAFLEEKRFAVASEYYHYTVRARGKKIDPGSISQKVQEMGLKFLWVHVIGESVPDENRRR